MSNHSNQSNGTVSSYAWSDLLHKGTMVISKHPYISMSSRNKSDDMKQI